MDLQRKIQQLRNDGDDEFADAIEDMIPRATVAAALRELRDVWQRRKNTVEDTVMEIVLRDVLDELDTTVAALGLADEAQDCPECGNSRQVWRNQITGKMTCHRAGCHKEISK